MGGEEALVRKQPEDLQPCSGCLKHQRCMEVYEECLEDMQVRLMKVEKKREEEKHEKEELTRRLAELEKKRQEDKEKENEREERLVAAEAVNSHRMVRIAKLEESLQAIRLQIAPVFPPPVEASAPTPPIRGSAGGH